MRAADAGGHRMPSYGDVGGFVPRLGTGQGFGGTGTAGRGGDAHGFGGGAGAVRGGKAALAPDRRPRGRRMPRPCAGGRVARGGARWVVRGGYGVAVAVGAASRAGGQFERDLLLEHLDRFVRERDQPVELLANAAVGELPLGRGRGLVDGDAQQLLRGVEAPALGFA